MSVFLLVVAFAFILSGVFIMIFGKSNKVKDKKASKGYAKITLTREEVSKLKYAIEKDPHINKIESETIYDYLNVKDYNGLTSYLKNKSKTKKFFEKYWQMMPEY